MAPFDISPRAALAAPTEPFVIHIQSIAILITAILSVLGAAWMIASFFTFPDLRSPRHQLILGLAISDFVMAFNFLLSSSMNVSGRWIGAPEQARFCSFNGYMTQVFVIQTDYWVLLIAVYTFVVLTDNKKWSAWLHERALLPWVVPWVLSVLWASIGLGVVGYGDIGGWCWFTSDEVRLLVNFVPRWAIIGIMFLMYARLYMVLFKAHRRLVPLDASGSNSNPAGSGSRQLEGTFNSSSHTRRLKQLARLMLLYPLAYAIIWSLPTGIRIYHTVSSQPAPWQVATIDKACIVLQGFVDAVIYGATEGSMANWRRLFLGGQTKRLSRVAFGSSGYATGGSVTKRRCTEDGKHGSQSASVDSLGLDDLGSRLQPSSIDVIELESIERDEQGAGLRIRKTVEIEVVTSLGRQTRLGLQRPDRTYFPAESGWGSFLDV
ncbi:hypothetical protein QBC34DRAFT_299670 [Podospora aff. communis PSN243]|uniref:G-protein coupled receptors family 2 profile 2 domain-containing protein n=1 Tax=Podospora aff. communis PSN243 TaxID=3040156 RepID=A0AAV9GM01_9PEZI|nr:hypothetical protein QBC34DRAFT_299670 [Podospora aff. communis PSN243]